MPHSTIALLMLNSLKEKISQNTFTFEARVNMRFDEAAYEDLVACLQALATELASARQIDKELALSLYTIPQAIQNLYLSLARCEIRPPITDRLEEACIELDALVIECLSGNPARHLSARP